MPAVGVHFLLRFLQGNKIYSGKQEHWLFVDKVCLIATEHRCIRNINATRNTGEQKKNVIINNEWNFHSCGRAWMNLFIVRSSPYTRGRGKKRRGKKKILQSSSVAGSYLGLPFIISHLLCVFTFEFNNTYQDHSVWKRARKVIMLRCLENGSLFWI